MIIGLILLVLFHRSPWYTASLQHVGNAHIPGPDVKLPLLQPQNATQDRARVDPNPHVHVKLQLFPHVPVVSLKMFDLFY